MDFDVDSVSGRLFTVDLKLNKAYVIDTKNSNQVTSYDPAWCDAPRAWPMIRPTTVCL